MKSRVVVGAAASSLALVLGLAAPAHAYTEVVVVYSGVWKALGTWQPSTKQLCVRVYNGTSAASAIAGMQSLNSSFGPFDVSDSGGDSNPTCTTNNIPGGQPFQMTVIWTNETRTVQRQAQGTGTT